MSKLLRGVRHVGKIKQQFQYTLILHEAEVPANIKHISILWTRGSKTAPTDYIACENGVARFDKSLTLVCSLFKNTKTGEYDSKRSRIIVKQKTDSGREHGLGTIRLELTNYISPAETSFDLDLPIQHKSKDSGVLHCTLVCKWMRAVDPDDDSMSVSDLSSVMSGLENDLYSESYEALPPISNFQIERSHVDEEVFHLRLEGLENSLRQLTSENQELKEQLESAQRRVRYAETREPEVDHQMQAEVTFLRDTNERLQEELVAARVSAQTHERNDTQLTNALAELASTKQRLKSYEAKYDQLDEKNRTLEEKVNDQNNRMNRMHENVCDKQKAYEGLETVYQELLSTMKNDNKNELMKRIAFQRAEIDDNEQTLEMVRKSWKESSDIMRTQLNTVHEALVKTKLEREELSGNYEVARQTISKLEQDTTRLRQDKLKLSERLTAYEVKTAQKMVELISTRSRMQVAESRVRDLEAQIAALHQKNSSSSTSMSNGYSEMMHLNTDEFLQHVQKSMSVSPQPPPPPSNDSMSSPSSLSRSATPPEPQTSSKVASRDEIFTTPRGRKKTSKHNDNVVEERETSPRSRAKMSKDKRKRNSSTRKIQNNRAPPRRSSRR